MAFSGTVSQTTFNTRRVIDNAARRCKLPAAQITSETIDIAKDQLYLMLSEWGNLGPQLWAIERQVYSLYPGAGDLVLDPGTIDVMNSNLRTLQPVEGTNTVLSASTTTSFTSAATVAVVGLLWSASSTVASLALERSDDGAVWTTAQTVPVTPVAGVRLWLDLATVRSALFFRVRAVAGVLGLTSLFLGDTPTEVPLYRMNRDDYASLPNKSFQGRPLQFWFDRQVRQPVMRLWPLPDASAATQQIVVWRQRHIMDVGTLAQEIEIPQRWYEAAVAGLAARLASELIEIDAGAVPALEAKAAMALNTALQEERDNSPIMIAPNISMYTR